MTGTEEGKPAPVPALGISFQQQVGQGTIVFQIHVAGDTPLGDIDKTLDILRLAADRQQAVEDLRQIDQLIYKQEQGLQNLQKTIAAMPRRAEMAHAAAGKRGPYKLSPKEEAEKATAETNIDVTVDIIKKMKSDRDDVLKRITREGQDNAAG